MALIVNADDFGKSMEVNRAITECFNRGYINRTTIMVNMPYAVEAFEMAEKNGFVDKVGIHLNLTEGAPVTTGISQNPYFCDEDGKFNQVFCHSKKLRLHMDDKSIFDIEKEIEAQYRIYTDLGFRLCHIDSHHHVHTSWPVLKALKNLSSDYKFSSIRLSRNLYRGGSKLNKIYKTIYNNQVKKICGETTDYFGSYTDCFEYFLNGNTFDDERFKLFCLANDVEIMVHPGYDDEDKLIDIGVGPMNKLLTL